MKGARNPRRQHAVKVFLSHGQTDVVLARKLRNLIAQHLDAIVFTADDLNAAEDWQSKLRHELSQADVVVALLTPASVRSNWVQTEVGAAWAMEKPIIPVVTSRHVLNQIPVSLKGVPVLEVQDIDTPATEQKFLNEFQDSLVASHVQ